MQCERHQALSEAVHGNILLSPSTVVPIAHATFQDSLHVSNSVCPSFLARYFQLQSHAHPKQFTALGNTRIHSWSEAIQHRLAYVLTRCQSSAHAVNGFDLAKFDSRIHFQFFIIPPLTRFKIASMQTTVHKD